MNRGNRSRYSRRFRQEKFVGKDMLEESNISTDKACMGKEVIEFVPFFMRWVAKE